MAKRYQVVGECAHVIIDTAAGPVSQLLYKPAPVPAGVDPKRIQHLLSVGLIAEVGGEADEALAEAPVVEAPVVEPDVKVDGGSGEPQAPIGAETGAEREAAKAKLPADGSAPPANAAQAAWVEYAVTKGYDFDACKGSKREELIALLSK